MICDNGEWILSPSDKIPELINKVVAFSNEAENELKNKYPNNKNLDESLKIIKKYNKMNDETYIDELMDDEENNKDEIKRCEDFNEYTYKTFKTTLYKEGKKLKKNLIKAK